MEQNILNEVENTLASHVTIRSTQKVPCQTFEELALQWLDQKQLLTKRSTFSNYVYVIQKHIIPKLGPLLLADITEESICLFIKQLQSEKYANSTISFILVVLRSILKLGAEKKEVEDRLPLSCHLQHRPKESMMLPHMESLQMRDYLFKLKTPFAYGLLLSRSTGLRIGELCGLRWDDFDFIKNTFTVRRTISRIPNPSPQGTPKTVLYIRSPKSNTSHREIPIPAYLRNELYQIRMDYGIYLLTGTAKCTEPRNVQKRFKTILKHCDLPDYNFHALRHGFASACLENGADCKTISSLLGHASIKTTMDIYLHSSLAQKKSCINGLS